MKSTDLDESIRKIVRDEIQKHEAAKQPLHPYLPISPWPSTEPYPPMWPPHEASPNYCPVCGINLKAAQYYSCGNAKCPSGIKYLLCERTITTDHT